MIHGTLELMVVHLTCGENRRVIVEHAWPAWKLEVRWEGNAGVYCVDLKIDRLRKSQRGAVLLWRCGDIEVAKRIWHQMIFPGKNVPNPLLIEEIRGPSVSKALPDARVVGFKKTKER